MTIPHRHRDDKPSRTFPYGAVSTARLVAALTNAAKSRSNSSGVVSVRSGWHWTPTTNRSSATAQQDAGSIARPGSSANRAWDLDELVWDSHGNLNVLGRLATDRPHVVKLYGSYVFPTATQVGAFFYGGSGTPVSQIPVMSGKVMTPATMAGTAR